MGGLPPSFMETIQFIGLTMGPFYLHDPQDPSIEPAFRAIASLDVKQAATEWPFVDTAEAIHDLELMQKSLGKTNPQLNDDSLSWEYRRLFIGPLAKPAPPWGSVYMDREQVIFGCTTLQLRRWMRENGIQRLRGNTEPEDQIGLMLLLMAWISQHRPDLLEDFLQLHLLTWSKHFLIQLAEATTHPFFQGLARLTNASLEGIRQALDLTIVYPRYYR